MKKIVFSILIAFAANAGAAQWKQVYQGPTPLQMDSMTAKEIQVLQSDLGGLNGKPFTVSVDTSSIENEDNYPDFKGYWTKIAATGLPNYALIFNYVDCRHHVLAHAKGRILNAVGNEIAKFPTGQWGDQGYDGDPLYRAILPDTAEDSEWTTICKSPAVHASLPALPPIPPFPMKKGHGHKGSHTALAPNYDGVNIG